MKLVVNSGHQTFNAVDFKKTMEEMVYTYKKGYDEFRKQVNESIQYMENFFLFSSKSQTDTKKK